LPLNIAQSFAAGQFIAVILAASLVLSEAISTAQWVGIFLIAAGIAIVGWSQ
jgi:undecaprenyl phosphate-alpha-L-ara4N flippase subunit ArnE